MQGGTCTFAVLPLATDVVGEKFGHERLSYLVNFY